VREPDALRCWGGKNWHKNVRAMVTILAAPVTLNDPVILSVPHGNAGDLSGFAIPGNNRVK